MVSPAASFSRMISTVMRVPATTGLPIMTDGSDWISVSFIQSPRLNYTSLCQRGTNGLPPAGLLVPINLLLDSLPSIPPSPCRRDEPSPLQDTHPESSRSSVRHRFPVPASTQQVSPVVAPHER